MCFRDLARQNESNSRSLWLCGEERHEQVRAARQPWTFVFDHDRNCAVLACPSDTDVATCLERCVNSVAEKVYKKLIKLVTIGANRSLWPTLDADRQACLQCGHSSYPCADIERHALRCW